MEANIVSLTLETFLIALLAARMLLVTFDLAATARPTSGKGLGVPSRLVSGIFPAGRHGSYSEASL